MSDGPHDQEPDAYVTADEPTTGPPAGAASASAVDADSWPGTAPRAANRPDPGENAGIRPTSAPDPTSTPDPSSTPGPGSAPGASTTSGAGFMSGKRSMSEKSAPSGTHPAGRPRTTGPEAEVAKRRKRRLLGAGIALAAGLVVIALCAGGLAVLRAFRHDAAAATDAREGRRLRDAACLELEDRLNRLVPPGATTTPRARAVAVRDENAATRIYLARLDDQRVGDGWRELLDARTAFAEALDGQLKSRTPAFYVAPAPRDGRSLADQLARWSPAACAGPIRRLAAPDL